MELQIAKDVFVAAHAPQALVNADAIDASKNRGRHDCRSHLKI
jgi:hypothetical protein